MRLYNTMTRVKEEFVPLGDPVRLYVCGVTPYDTTHLGHARTYLLFDVLQRRLCDVGMTVKYVQNVTDVDDPLTAKAKELGTDYRQLAERYTAIFLEDLAGLNILMPEVYCRATDEIERIIQTTRLLIDRGMAYERGGTVYFRAHRFPGYGAMSRLDRDARLTAHRETGEDPANPDKEDGLDFRLWQRSGPGDPAWPSPWGDGRPGWHIECSSMVNHYLGPRIDIHGGGEDLIFPHHCSEIAQSETATGESPFVRYWVHVGMVRMDGDKMSKSKGNLAFVRDLLPIHGAGALRAYVLGFPYRQQFEYLEGDLRAAKARWTAIERQATGPTSELPSDPGLSLYGRIVSALDDDLDTPLALSTLAELARLVETTDRTGDRRLLVSAATLLGFRLN